MNFTNPKYPNLELIEYMFRQQLDRDEEWKEKFKKKREKDKYARPCFEMIVFPQIWGSTCTAFDVTKDGEPTIGGSAMTKAYTVVVKECLTETYGIFINDCPCYMVTDPTFYFMKDLEKRDMKPLSEAQKLY